MSSSSPFNYVIDTQVLRTGHRGSVTAGEEATQEMMKDDNQQTSHLHVFANFSELIMAKLDEQRKHGSMCDATVITNDGGSFKAHKAVLAACSRYLETELLSLGGNTNEKNKSSSEAVIHLGMISSESFNCILNMIYTSKLLLTKANVAEILLTANILDLDQVSDICRKFLRAQISSRSVTHTSSSFSPDNESSDSTVLDGDMNNNIFCGAVDKNYYRKPENLKRVESKESTTSSSSGISSCSSNNSSFKEHGTANDIEPTNFNDVSNHSEDRGDIAKIHRSISLCFSGPNSPTDGDKAKRPTSAPSTLHVNDNAERVESGIHISSKRRRKDSEAYSEISNEQLHQKISVITSEECVPPVGNDEHTFSKVDYSSNRDRNSFSLKQWECSRDESFIDTSRVKTENVLPSQFYSRYNPNFSNKPSQEHLDPKVPPFPLDRTDKIHYPDNTQQLAGSNPTPGIFRYAGQNGISAPNQSFENLFSECDTPVNTSRELDVMSAEGRKHYTQSAEEQNFVDSNKKHLHSTEQKDERLTDYSTSLSATSIPSPSHGLMNTTPAFFASLYMLRSQALNQVALLNASYNQQNRGQSCAAQRLHPPFPRPPLQQSNSVVTSTGIICKLCRLEFTTEWSLAMHCRIYHPLNQVYQTPSFSHTEKMIEMPKSTNHDAYERFLNSVERSFVGARSLSSTSEVPVSTNSSSGGVEEEKNSDFNFTAASSNQPAHRCYHCKKEFATIFLLRKHRTTEHMKRPFKCHRCDSAFPNKAGLQVHLRSHTGERPYRCKVCNKAFTQLGHVQRHQKVHTGEKPYQCPLCQARVRDKASMHYHILAHRGVKPFKCDQCDARFTKRSSLVKHKNVHTGDYLYQCPQCKASFREKASLSRHVRSQHKDPCFTVSSDLVSYNPSARTPSVCLDFPMNTSTGSVDETEILSEPIVDVVQVS